MNTNIVLIIVNKGVGLRYYRQTPVINGLKLG